jgi:glutamine---fructose-6-phosphate transaminase (isomerizing)
MSILLDEIHQQPEAMRAFLEREASVVAAIAQALTERSFQYIFFAARGTSDNAARYGQYLFGSLNRLPVALAAPSLFTVYNTPPRLDGALVIGISQSGQSPDVVSVVEEARRQGAPCVAITNDPHSPMAQAADHHIFLGVGQERSVAATKTYTAQLAALALLSVKMAGLGGHEQALLAAPEHAARALEAEPQARAAALGLAGFDRAVVLGRGIHYATAYETALKIKELAYLGAEAYSSADFRHGPIALAEVGLPVLLFSQGAAFRAELSELRADLLKRGARLVSFSDEAELGAGAGAPESSMMQAVVPLPREMPEWLAPLAAVIPGQLFAYYLSLARGYDPDLPRTLNKVTKTY